MSIDIIGPVLVAAILILIVFRQIVMDRREKKSLCPKCGKPLPEDGGIQVSVVEGGARPRIYMMCAKCAPKWENASQLKKAFIAVSILGAIFVFALLLKEFYS